MQFQIAHRIRLFMSLPIKKINRISLQTKRRETASNVMHNWEPYVVSSM